MNTIRTKVVGVSKKNPNGQSRQDLIETCIESGDNLDLVRDHENPYDENAIGVYIRTGEQIGFISGELAEKIAPLMDDGYPINCTVLAVTGGPKEGKLYGVNVEVKIYDKKEQAAYVPPVQEVTDAPPPASAPAKKRGKLKWILLGSPLVLCLLCLGLGAILNSTPSARATQTVEAVALMTERARPTNTPEPTSTPEPTATPEIDRNIKALMDGADMNQEEAEAVFEVVKSVGFEQVKSFSLILNLEDSKEYAADFGYTRNFGVSMKGNEIELIDDQSRVYFDKSSGGIVNNINDYYLSSTERGTFMYLAEDYVKMALKAPSSAKFPGHIMDRDQWKVAREKDTVWVQSWVDAQNAFGAMLRNSFTAQISYSTEELLYLVLDGEVMYGSRQEP
jgi:hypothetical protein